MGVGVAAAGLGEGEGEGLGEGDGLGEGKGDGEGLGEGEGMADASGWALAATEGCAEGAADGSADGNTVAVPSVPERSMHPARSDADANIRKKAKNCRYSIVFPSAGITLWGYINARKRQLPAAG